jgi:hypothetical protein
MPPLVKRGRAIVGAIVVTHLAFAVAVILLSILMGRFEQLPRMGFKFVATASTCYGLWRGSRWAKGLYVFGFAVAALACLFLAANVRPGVMLLTGGMGVMFGALAGVLLFSPSVNAFLAYQRDPQVFLEDEPEVKLAPVSARLCTACGHAATGVNMFCSECGMRIG